MMVVSFFDLRAEMGSLPHGGQKRSSKHLRSALIYIIKKLSKFKSKHRITNTQYCRLINYCIVYFSTAGVVVRCPLNYLTSIESGEATEQRADGQRAERERRGVQRETIASVEIARGLAMWWTTGGGGGGECDSADTLRLVAACAEAPRLLARSSAPPRETALRTHGCICRAGGARQPLTPSLPSSSPSSAAPLCTAIDNRRCVYI